MSKGPNSFKAPFEDKIFWSMAPAAVADVFEVDHEVGLSEDEANHRLSIHGSNKLTEDERESPWHIFLMQFKSPLIIILLFAALVTLSISEFEDAIFILVAILVNTALGFYQEYKAEKALAELKNYIKDRVHVIRGGREFEIDAEELVPGDVVRLSQGDRIAADGRLISSSDLEIDEAILTGESLASRKSIASVAQDALLGDQSSMVFAGTLAVQGIGTYIVCRTGESTELGKIADMVALAEDEETPLQSRIRRFSLTSSAFLVALTVVVFIIGIASGELYTDMFLTSVAIAVSAIPEGLPISLTVILAVGVERMARRRGVVRKLVAAESLGSTSVILTDKTGTLTEASMKLSDIIPLQGDDENAILTLALINSSVIVENRETSPELWRITGPIMEKALVRAAAIRGMDDLKIKRDAKIEQTLMFNATNKFSASLSLKGGAATLSFFGAPDILLAHSTLDNDGRVEVFRQIDALASEGKRVLGVAERLVTGDMPVLGDGVPMAGLVLRGLIAFRDPVRPGVKEVMHRVERAGIKTVIVTGDHRGTARSIAAEVGLPSHDSVVIEAKELESLNDDELREVLKRVRVIARVTPADKLRIVRAYQAMGEVVAMTGDGVNDAPSIKQADIGIAMGTGTEVSRNVADLVLLDDNFETIVAAIDEGRQIAHNIKKVIVYLFSNVTDGFLLIGGAIIVGVPLPLNALQILWVNFFSDSLPAIAYAFEKDQDMLSSGRSTLRDGLFDRSMKFLIIGIGGVTSVMLLGAYFMLLNAGFDVALVRTFIFMCFGTYTLFLSMPLRNLEKGIWEYSPFSNKYMLVAISAGLVLMLSAVYVHSLQSLFDTVALPPSWLALAFLFGLLNIALVELGKSILSLFRK